MPSKAKIKKHFFPQVISNAAILAVSILLSLLIGEVAIRTFAPQQLIVLSKGLYQADATFGWRHKKNMDTVVNMGGGLVHFITDEHGWREREHSTSKLLLSPDFSILTLGDSILEALQIDTKWIFPSLLEDKLSAQWGNVKVVNTGVAGWGPMQYYLESKLAFAETKVDLGVVFIYTDNDAVMDRHIDVYKEWHQRSHPHWPRGLGLEEIKASILFPLNDYLRERSHLFLFLKLNLYPLLNRMGLVHDAYRPSFVIYDVLQKNSPRWPVTADICADIEKEFSKRHTPVFFIIIPAYFQVYENIFFNYIHSIHLTQADMDISQPNVRLRDEMQSRGLRVYDFLPEFRLKAKQGMKLYGKADKHLSREGHEVTSEMLVSILEPYLKNSLTAKKVTAS